MEGGIVTMRKLASVVACLAVMAGLSWATQESVEDAAQAAAETWLKLVDSESYDGSWEQAAELFKGAVTKEQWRQAASGARKPLGKLVSRKLKSRQYMEQMPGAPDGKYVVIQFDAVFENKSAAVETVTPMLDPDGTWRVSGYYIR
jgi:hypothetical protein